MASGSSIGICEGKSKPEIVFFPQANTNPEKSYKISEYELFRRLLKQETTVKVIGDEQDTDTTNILKAIDLKSKITHVETHKWFPVCSIEKDSIFVVFETTSEEDRGHWWSLEVSAECVTLQRSQDKITVINQFKGKNRNQVEPIAEGLKGKGSIQDFFILLWIHTVIDVKCQIFLSRCESFIPLAMKKLTETFYEYSPDYFTYSALSSEEINPVVEEITNFLTKVTKWQPLLCLTYLGDIHQFDKVLGNDFFNKIDGIYNRMTLLNSAILFCKTAMVKYLLEEKNANARKRDKAGRNALHMAALFTDKEEIIKLLMNSKIKVDACYKSGMTALHYAVISSNMTVARHLIDHGADFKRLDPTGHSPLHLATHYAKDSQILELLLTKVEIDQCDSTGITALHSAALASNAVSARYLIEKGADINRVDKRGRTPVHAAAAFAKNVDFFNIFLGEEKADLGCCDERKLTVLAYAKINQFGLAKEIVSSIEKKNNDKPITNMIGVSPTDGTSGLVVMASWLHEEEDLLFKGKNIHCRKEPLFKGRGDSLVYSGYFKKANDPKEEIVVRKIKVTDCCDKWKDIFNRHHREKDPIKHKNVLKIISYEEMDEWRFFALERYDATLEQFCKGFYKGPMPSDAQVLCQITKGLLYLHSEQCTHGNLTPRTILIASSQPVRMMIKLSEFGLSKFCDQCDEEPGKQQDLCQMKYWRIDGTTENNQTPTIDYNQDIFSASCLCFYFLTRGVHPFGDDSSSILENIKKRNPVNLLPTIQQGKDIWEFAYEPIKNMIGNPQNPTLWLLIAKTCFMKALPLRFEVKKENELGRGTFGVVYRGTYEGNAIAVKVTVKVDLDDARKKEQKREMEEHLRLHHENVLKLLHVDDSRDKTLCLVLELCAGTLKDYCEDKYKGPELPPDGIVLYQMASGLHYIHSRNLVHRDVKPANILISMTTPVQMKLSDFGFVKKTSHRGTFTQSGLKGTLNWMAPEILKLVDETITELPHGTIQSDTFAAGCVFFYFLARGKHPFGKSIQIGGNILKNKPIELNKHNENLQGEDRVLYELIGKMIKLKEERISLPEVIEQLTAKLYASRQFKEFEMVISEWSRCVTRFHPTEPVLACSVDDKVIFLTADNSSIPFSNWKEMKTQLQPDGIFLKFYAIEWIAGGTQLAAIGHRAIVNADDSVITENVIVCWSYPSGEILFQEKLNDEKMNQIEWNPFRLNVFATFHMESFSIGKKVFFFNSCPVDQRPFHFCTIEHDITSFQWISENRVALGITKDGGIEILEIDESTTSVKIVKRIKHESVTCPILIMAWDERTKCLAACSDDGWMAIWSMDSDQPIHKTKVDGHCWSLAWRPNGKQTDDAGVDAARKSADNFILACGLDNGQIVIWTPLAEEKIRILRQHSRWVHSLSFSPDGRFLASADENGKLIIWSAENWQPVYIGQEGIIRYKSFSWMSPSTDVSDYKLTFDSYSDKVRVVEYAVGQNEKSSEDGSPPGKWSIGPSVDLK